MAKESKQADQPEAVTPVAEPRSTSRLSGWAIAGISAAGALLIAGSAAAGAVVGVAALGPEPRGGEHQLEQMHERGDDDHDDRYDDRDEDERGRGFGERDGHGERDGDRAGDGFQRGQGPGMPNQQDAPQQQPAPAPQTDVTP